MPWQVVPSFLIIGGAFNVIALGIWAVDRVYYGERGRQILRDRFDWKLEQRDHLIVEYKAMLAKAAAEAGKTK